MKAVTTILILCVGSLFAQNSLAQEKVRLAVTKISNSGTAVSDEQLKQLTDWLGSELTDKFRIITRENVTMMLEQQAEAQALGCDKESCMADIAKSVNADLSLAGSLSRHGDKFILNIRLVRADASVAAAMDEEIPAMHLQFGIDQAKPLMKFTALRLWRVYTGQEKASILPAYRFIVAPERANVYLQGERICERTPCFWQPKVKGEYTFTFRAYGFEENVMKLAVEPGDQETITKEIQLRQEEEKRTYSKHEKKQDSTVENNDKYGWFSLFLLGGIGGWITSGIYNAKYQTAVENYQNLKAGDSLETYNNAWRAVETNYKMTYYATIGTAASFTIAVLILKLWPDAKAARFVQPIVSGLSYQRNFAGFIMEEKYEWRYNYAF